MKRLEVELVAIGHGRQRLADPKVGIEELHVNRLAAGQGDDRSRVNLVGPVGVGRIGDRDRDRVGSAVVVARIVRSEGRP